MKKLKILAGTLRIHQWSKNVLLWVPMLTASRGDALSYWGIALKSFFAFSTIASCVYIANDLADRSTDRNHPKKKLRPIAAGAISPLHASLLAGLCLVCGIYLSLDLGGGFLKIILAYVGITTAYTFWLKKIALVDIMILALLYSVRIFAGGLAANLDISHWLLSFSMFFFVSLAIIKRCADLIGKKSDANLLYKVGQYVPGDLVVLETIGISSGVISVLVFALYISSPEVRQYYHHPEYLYGINFIIFFSVARLWLKTHRGEVDEDPVKSVWKDPANGVLLALASLFFYLAISHS